MPVMTRRERLHLHEEVMLLALRNEKGTIAAGTMYPQAAGGAILAELLLQSRVRVETEGRKTFVVPNNPAPLGDEVLDECLAKVTGASRRGKLQSWVERFAGVRQLKHRVAAGLADKGILRATEDKVLLIFKRRIYPEVDSDVERRIIARLEDAIFSDSATVDPRTTVLLAIAHHAGLLKVNFDKKRLKSRTARIKSVIAGDAIGKATNEAIQAVQAAVMVATVMPAIVAATTTH